MEPLARVMELIGREDPDGRAGPGAVSLAIP
jgi:hypothetical protein